MTREEKIKQVIQDNKNSIDNTLWYLDGYAETIIRAAKEAQNYLNARKEGKTVEGSSLINLNTSIIRVFDTIEDDVTGASLTARELILKANMQVALNYINKD